MDSSLGISRRTLLRRGAVVGGALVWTTPVVQSLAGPAIATGTGVGDLSCVAVLLRREDAWYRMKWEPSFLGSLGESTGAFNVPGSADQLYPLTGTLQNGGAPGTSAALNADGSVTVTLGSGCQLVDFVVVAGSRVAGPRQGGEPAAGQTGGTVNFPVPTSNISNSPRPDPPAEPSAPAETAVEPSAPAETAVEPSAPAETAVEPSAPAKTAVEPLVSSPSPAPPSTAPTSPAPASASPTTPAPPG